MRFEQHDFYCMKCGKKGIPLSRNKGFKHGKFHRKKLYCLSCKEEVNHIECRNDEEVKIFKENFELGVYLNEAEESISYVRSSGGWEVNLCATAH